MSSAYKTFKTSDITVFPYKASKTFSYTQDTVTDAGISTVKAFNYPSDTVLFTAGKSVYYRSARQLFYSNGLASLAPSKPLSEQNYDELVEDEKGGAKTSTTLMYDNFLQSTATSGSSEYDSRKNFPTESGDTVTITSIPAMLYGENIRPGSFSINSTEGDFASMQDDGNGNIVTVSGNVYVGNIIYSQGIVVLIIDIGDILGFSSYPYNLSFKSELTIYQSQVRCHINENEFNMTLNPSAVSGSYGDVSNNITGSAFQPYATTVGLYNAANELLAVGKLAQPTPIPSNTDVTFIVKWDS
jgi:hypothetical protein